MNFKQKRWSNCCFTVNFLRVGLGFDRHNRRCKWKREVGVRFSSYLDDDNRVDPLTSNVRNLKVRQTSKEVQQTNQNQRFPILGTSRMNEQLCTRANTVRIIIKKYIYIFFILFLNISSEVVWSYRIDYRMETLPVYCL